jgi:WD40 repeat protein
MMTTTRATLIQYSKKPIFFFFLHSITQLRLPSSLKMRCHECVAVRDQTSESNMDFTEIFKARAAVFSPDSRYVLTSVDDRIIVRLANTFQVSQAWQIHPQPADGVIVDTAISRSSTSENAQCAWSCDSRYILAALGGLVQVFDLVDKDWMASIQTGAEGLAKALWAPDGRCILCFSEWGVGDCL